MAVHARQLPGCEAPDVDVIPVEMRRASVPSKLNLKLHLVFLHRTVAHSAGGTDSWPAPQSVVLAVRELALFDGFAGSVAEKGLAWHRTGLHRAFDLESRQAEPGATSKDAGCVNQRNAWGGKVSVAFASSGAYWTLVLPGCRPAHPALARSG